jgi:hypothetical protein
MPDLKNELQPVTAVAEDAVVRPRA